MASAITFGGLGDILTFCKVGNNLARALSDKSGSRRQYLEFCDEVQCLVQVLTQVVVIFEERESSLFMEQLFTIIKPIVDECGTAMQEELMRIHNKYHDSLRSGGSGSSSKDALKKLQFGVTERTKLQETMERLRARTQQLSILVTIAGERATRADATTIRSKLDGFEDFLVRIAKKGDDCEQCIARQDPQLHLISKTTQDIYGQTAGIVTEICEIKHSLDRIIADRHYHASNAGFLNGPDPTLGKPVLFEDSFGTVLELPTEWIHSWQFFQQLLQHHFQELKGHRMVIQGKYALEENITGNDLNQSLPPKASFRRGMKINMSMIFTRDQMTPGVCPRCGIDNNAPENANVKCQTDGCGVWFRLSRPVAVTVFEGRQPQPSSTRNFSQEELGELYGIASQIQEDPADFQRVRLLAVEAEGVSIRKGDATFDHQTVNEQAQANRGKENRHQNIQDSRSSQPRYNFLTSAVAWFFSRRSGLVTMTRDLPSYSFPEVRRKMKLFDTPDYSLTPGIPDYPLALRKPSPIVVLIPDSSWPDFSILGRSDRFDHNSAFTSTWAL